MLRSILIPIMAVLTVIAILVTVSGHFGFWLPAVWAAFLLLCLLIERTQYKAELTVPPDAEWVATNEVNADERGTVRVYYHPRTGERAYVREPAI